MKHISIKILLLLLIFNPINTYAETKIVLQSAIDNAIAKSPEIAQLRQSMITLAAEKSVSITPEKFNFSYMQEGIKDANVAESRLTFSQKFESPFRISYLIDAHNQLIKSKENLIEIKKWELIYNIKIAYYEVLNSKMKLDIDKANWRLSDSLKLYYDERTKAGFANESQNLKAKLIASKAESQYKASNLFFRQSIDNFLKTAYLDSIRDPLFDEELKFFRLDHKELKPKIDELANFEKAYYSNLKEANNANSSAVAAEFFPATELIYYKQNYGNAYDHTGYEVKFSIPLWFFGDQNRRMEIFESNNKELELEEQHLRNNINRQLKNVLSENEIATEKVLNLSMAQSDASRLLIMAKTELREGKTDLLNYIDSQKLYYDIEYELIDALLDLHKAKSTLEFILKTNIN